MMQPQCPILARIATVRTLSEFPELHEAVIASKTQVAERWYATRPLVR